MATYLSGQDPLAQREASQLRLNAELDAGARAVFSDMETCLRAPPPRRPPNANAMPPRTVAANNATAATTRENGSRGTTASRGSSTKGAASSSSSSRALQFHPSVAGVEARTAAPGAAAVGQESTAARSAGVCRTRGSIGAGDGEVDSMDNNGEQGNRQVSRVGGQEARLSAGRSEPQVSQTLRASMEGTGGDTGGIPAGIGEGAAARFLKAKLSACETQLEQVVLAHQASQEEVAVLRTQSASEQEHARRVLRQLQLLQQTSTKETKAKEDDAAHAATLLARVTELERELATFKRAARQADTEKKSLEVRLDRALEETSKQKGAVQQAHVQSKDLGQGQRAEVTRLEGHCRRLERQKLEMLSALKKQLKLIDLLKRQKFHVEAARVLGFTEEEFLKTLDWRAT